MAIEDLREIGNVLYERRADGMLYPVRRVRPDTEARGVPPQDPSLLNVGGIGERLAFLNQTFNPVEGIGGAMRAGERLFSQDADYLQRIEALGSMMSGVAGIAAPIAAARAIGVPAASAMMEGLLGFSPTTQAAGDTMRAAGRDIVDRLNQPGQMPTVYSNPIPGRPPLTFAEVERAMQGADESGGFRLYQGSPHDFNAERLVRYPDGRTEYIVGRPDVLPDVPAGAEVLQDFPLGRQRMDKIGTGEGAQAYGYGLYGAEAEGVARGYRDQLSRPYLATADGQNIAEKYGSDVADIFEMAGGEPDDMRATVTRLRQIVKENLDDIGVSDVSQLKSEFYGDLPSTIIDFSNRADRLENLLNSGDVKLVNEGKLYELNINANPEDFLDWDKPLSEQPQRVRDALGRIGVTSADTGNEAYMRSSLQRFAIMKPDGTFGPGPDTYDEALALVGGDPSKVRRISEGSAPMRSEALRREGIPGIRYLDEGSRGRPYRVDLAYKGRPFEEGYFEPQFARSKEEAENIAKEYRDKGYDANVRDVATRNYVVFDENLIEIVRKYGIAGAAAMLGVSAVDVEEAIAQGAPPSQWDQLVVGPQ
jgi:hypothetical protein